MNNPLYFTLLNASFDETESMLGRDFVPEIYQPISRHATIQKLAELLFGFDLQTQLYWICKARLAIRNTSLSNFVTESTAEGGYRLDDIADELGKYLSPVMTTNWSALPQFGEYVLPSYTVSRFAIEKDSTEMVAKSLQGSEIGRAPIVNGQAYLTLIPQQDAGCVVPETESPFWITWASRPELDLAGHYEASRSQTDVLVRSAVNLDSVFDAIVLESLREVAELGVQSVTAFSAASLIVAGHTAKRMGISL